MKLKAKTELAKKIFKGKDYILRWCSETKSDFKTNFEIIRY